MTKKHFVALADAIREIAPKTERHGWPCPYCSAGNESGCSQCDGSGILAGTTYTAGEIDGEHNQQRRIINTLADFCQSQNSRFDRSRWLAYIAGECGPNGGAVKGGR